MSKKSIVDNQVKLPNFCELVKQLRHYSVDEISEQRVSAV